jgi:hypothetical protein
MPIFFKSQPRPSYQVFEPIVYQALGMDRIIDTEERGKRTKELVGSGTSQAAPAPIVWWRVGVAFLLLVALFVLAISISNEKAGDTLLNCFQLLFTATLGLFGIEAAKNG